MPDYFPILEFGAVSSQRASDIRVLSLTCPADPSFGTASVSLTVSAFPVGSVQPIPYRGLLTSVGRTTEEARSQRGRPPLGVAEDQPAQLEVLTLDSWPMCAGKLVAICLCSNSPILPDLLCS
ncbi:hypothetical protein FOZ60_009864 [Perkinsus olseni]|uniref:Uncharacterized protein n=1 Tax=Perkinsus olseni TaxID=32597 RepID=A0A7J6PNS0_PEROL|nr:hypothetical protein FOZ60_009864 [Perkinsus olseni]